MRGRESLRALKKRIDSKSQESVAKGDAVKAKRFKRRAFKAKADVPDFSDAGQTQKKVVNSNAVRDWFREGIDRNYGHKVTNHFGGEGWKARGKQGKLAKKLLEEHGPDMVKKAVDYLCDHWEVLRENSKGKLTGMPTVALLWAMKETVIADIELGRIPRRRPKKHMVGEYTGRGNMPKVGWGNEQESG